MKADSEANASRREFLRSAARRISLSLLAVIMAWLAYRRQIARAVCVNNSLCQGCGVLAHCTLPAALQAKNLEPKREL